MAKIEIKRHGKAMPYEVTLEGPGTKMKVGTFSAFSPAGACKQAAEMMINTLKKTECGDYFLCAAWERFAWRGLVK